MELGRLVRVCALGIAMLAGGDAVHAGDKDVAEFLLRKAEKAYRARRYREAVEDFRRARAEFTPLPEAAFGLGQALEKLEEEAAALAAYRACVRDVESAGDPPSRWKSLSRRAASAIKRLRRRFADLDERNRELVADLLAFAKKHRTSSPRWARAAYETVLRVEPGHDEARRGLAALAKAPAPDPPAGTPPPQAPDPPPETAGNWGRALVRDDTLAGWTPGVEEPWSCAGGVIAGDVRKTTGHINWMDEAALAGRFEVRGEIRVVRSGGPRRTFGMFLGDGKHAWHGFLVDDENSLVIVRFEDGRNTHVADAIPRTYHPGRWHEWRLVVNRDTVTVHLAGKKLLEHKADEGAFDGKLGLFAQNGRIEYRNLRVKP